MEGDSVAFQRITADGAVLAGGVPVKLYSVNILSTGTAAQIIFRDGALVTSTNSWQEVGTASQGVTREFAGGKGVVWPNGCYVDVDGNTTHATVTFTKV